MSKARAKKIKAILFDVDGVLTDGTIWLVPSSGNTFVSEEKRTSVAEGGLNIASGNIVEAKGFNAHDGVGFSLARMGGLKTGIITRRNSQTVALRAHDLKLDIVYQGQMDKLKTFHKILNDFNFSAEQVAYVGDDIVDLPVMEACGLAICVPNSRWEVEQASHYMTDHAGGQGAARDAIEYILKAQGILKQSIEKYLKSH
jgi:3-deoxy-D-manno-octulosonate 8-phosphate phosphatase (KDO 8-P phosphatase)